MYVCVYAGCVKSQVFLQHVLAAMDGVEDSKRLHGVWKVCVHTLSLSPAPQSSIATVDCAGYPDVCQRFTITTLPSALVFHSSHPHTPTPLPIGTLDSQSLLAALKELQPQTTDLVCSSLACDSPAPPLPTLPTLTGRSHTLLPPGSAERLLGHAPCPLVRRSCDCRCCIQVF